jgi:putative flavoprotein involved in K+ transport
MTTQHIETLIIGGGQAGLATGYYLRQEGRPCLILEANARLGDQWRNAWDSLHLYTAARYDGLPGLPFPKGAWEFPHKDEVADYMENYALAWDLPVRTSTRVESLDAGPDGGYVVTLTSGETISCENVVVATGPFGRIPNVPTSAAGLDRSVHQLHSSEYRRPGQIPPGKVLVVGASHSGTDIAYELALTHDVVLAGRDCGQIPWRIEKRFNRIGFRAIVFMFKHVLTRRTPMGRKGMEEFRQHGGPMIRVKRSDLKARGVERVTARFAGVRAGRPELDDNSVVGDVTSVVWCTGFKHRFDWINLPVFGENGWPEEFRGEVAESPGLWFCGLAFQYSVTSMFLLGARRDAKYVARGIVKRAATRTPIAA